MANVSDREFIRSLKDQMSSDDYASRDKANLALLSYDLGRATTETERTNARNEYNFRMWIVAGYSVAEALETVRKYKGA